MDVDGVNPYQSPAIIEDAPVRLAAPRIAVRIARAIVLGLLGYGIYLAAFLRYTGLHGFGRWEGVFIALVFAGSDVLNTGRGHAAGIVRRIGICGIIMLASLFIAAGLGAGARGSFGSGYSDLMFCCLGSLIFAIGVTFVRIAWIREAPAWGRGRAVGPTDAQYAGPEPTSAETGES